MDRANFNSWAAKQQSETSEEDNSLWNATEKKHPLCHWWWGRRIMGYKTGAYCYLCDKMIVTWDGKYPIPVKARKAIMEHRRNHLD